MHLACLVERITRNVGEKRLTGAVFLDVTKTFDTVWIDGLLYKLTFLNFPSYIVHTISSYLRGRTFEASFQTATSSRRGMKVGVALLYPLQSVCQCHALSFAPRGVGPLRGRHSHHSHVRKPTLLVSYLESYFNDLQRWLSEWRIAINVSKSTAIIFASAGRRFIQPRPVKLFRESIQLIETTLYPGVILDTRLTWSPHIDQLRKRATQMLGILCPLLNRKSDLSVRNGFLLYKQLIRPMIDYVCPVWRFAARTRVRRLQVLQSKCLRLATGVLWYVSNRQIQEDQGVPLFADHIRALNESFDSKLTDVGNLLVRQLGRYLL